MDTGVNNHRSDTEYDQTAHDCENPEQEVVFSRDGRIRFGNETEVGTHVRGASFITRWPSRISLRHNKASPTARNTIITALAMRRLLIATAPYSPVVGS